jgi:hypothetical protein
MDDFVVPHREEKFILVAWVAAIPFKKVALYMFPFELFAVYFKETVILQKCMIFKHEVQLI